MNTLAQLLDVNHILLQRVSTSFQINLIYFLSVAVIVLAIAVLIVVYRALQAILATTRAQQSLEETLTIDWVKVLFLLTIGLGIISIYTYSKFI